MKVLTVFLIISMTGTCAFVYGRPQQDAMIEDKDINVLAFEDAQYPPLAYNAHIQGIVVVNVGLNDKGQVVNATALSGPLLLASVSIDNVKKWVFNPTAKKTAIIVYNYKILEGRCNHNSTFFILQEKNIATVIACPGVVNPSGSQKSGVVANPSHNATN